MGIKVSLLPTDNIFLTDTKPSITFTIYAILSMQAKNLSCFVILFTT